MIDKKGMLEKMLMQGESSPSEKMSGEQGIAAKIAALQDILNTIQAELGGKVKSDMGDMGMKKVSVMAPDEKSLTEGLEIASEMAADKGGSLLDDEDMMAEAGEESSEGEKIAELKDTSMDSEEDEDQGSFGRPKKKSNFA